MEFNKNSNGITLIALTISMIVMLTLIGVVSNLIKEDGDILAEATSVADETLKAIVKEDVELTLAEKLFDYYGDVNRRAYGDFQEYWQSQLPLKTGKNAIITKEENPVTGEISISYVAENGKEYDITVDPETKDIIITNPSIETDKENLALAFDELSEEISNISSALLESEEYIIVE